MHHDSTSPFRDWYAYHHRRFMVVSNLISLFLTIIVLSSARIKILTPTSSKRALNQDWCCHCPPQPPPTTIAPSLSPSSVPRQKILLEALAMHIDLNLLLTNRTDYGQAFHWMVHVDQVMLHDMSAAHILQRFILVLFYTSTSWEQPWLSCNAPTANNDDEDCTFQFMVEYLPREELIIYEPIVGSTRWLSPTKLECQWAGITCDAALEVQSLDLNGQEIRGTLPKELLTLLPQLHTLDLAYNNLYGRLPLFGQVEVCGDITPGENNRHHLEYIDLNQNLLTGPIPLEWFDCVGTKWMSMSNNLFFGTIAVSSSSPVERIGLLLYNNLLFGTIPTELGRLSRLSALYLNENILSGTLPTEMGSMSLLQELFVYDNFLEGSLPAELSNLVALKYLAVTFNGLSGSIPDLYYQDWRSFPSLLYFNVGHNLLTGTIRSLTIGSQLEELFLNDNLLSGTVPTTGIHHFTSLHRLWIQGNDFVGSVKVCSSSLVVLEQVVADCNEIECECCTICCFDERANC